MDGIKIPVKTKSPATNGEGDLKKQIGCMNGILQLFDRHHFITGSRVSGHDHKRLLQGARRRQGILNTVKGPEVLREKPRMSTESSRASCSSSTCSTSTFSSLDCNRTAQPETLSQTQISMPEKPFQIIAAKEQPPLTKSMQTLDLRDIVKGSMYREARSVCIKNLATDERRGTVMKHIDSPRPSQQFRPGKPKATDCEGSPRVLLKDLQKHTKNSKEEQLAPRRFSYDGRDSKETSKWSMKYKELPRLSLDSKSTSLKSLACESKLNFPAQHQSCQALASNQEGHNRSSSIVAKLMGLESIQQTDYSEERRTQALSSCPKEAFLSTSTTERSRQNQGNSPCVSKSNSAASSPRFHNVNYVREPIACSKLPLDRAPWRQEDCSQGSQLKLASQSGKAASTSHLSSSVYGEIEKRITELEFKQSGKDLRALKQILAGMEKTRERLGNQREESAEFTLPGRCNLEENHSAENSKLSMSKNVQSYHQVCTNKGPCMPKQLGSSNLSMKEAKIMDKVHLSTQAPTAEILQLQRLQTRFPTYHREISAPKQKVDDALKKNNVINPSRHLTSTHKKTRRNSEVNQHLAGPCCINPENCKNSAKIFGVKNPSIRHNSLTLEEQSYPSVPLSYSHGIRKKCIKKVTEKSTNNRKHKVRAKDLHLTDDELSELSNETRCASCQGDIASVQSEGNSQFSQSETGFISATNSTDANARQREISGAGPTRRKTKSAVENAGHLLEQPSPISVLDYTFYNEDTPSPVKKTSSSFRDESPSSDDVECDLKNPNHSAACRRSDPNYKYSQKQENMKHSVSELGFMDTEPDKIVGSDNEFPNGCFDRDHRYITKILLTSGLLRDSNILSMTDQILPPCHLINPDIFHVLEQAEDIMDFNEVTKNKDNLQLNKKLQRRIIFDAVDEILVRKIHSGRYTVGNKSTSPQRLSKEVYLEMDRLCRISDRNFDNVREAMTSFLTAHVLYPSEDWADYSGELPALVLDIERQIFKNLINEVITGEVLGFHNQPKRPCRQLFSH